MFGPLTIADYSLIVVGACIYRRTESSPIATLATLELAHDVCSRLNGSLAVSVSRHPDAPTQLVYGR